MSRAYSFLETTGLDCLPNEYGLPVFLVRRKGDVEYERQPARSIEAAVRAFVRYADVKSGTIEALQPDANPESDIPFTYQLKGNLRILVK